MTSAARWAAVALLATSGCAATRGTLDIRIELPPNPSSEKAFQAPRVEDARRFDRAPPSPSIPSLKNADEIGDPAITTRAIARKRNSYGMAMGDILLPEGRTVPALVGDAIVRAFRAAGYAVRAPADPGYADAIPVDARIDQLWGWMRLGASVPTIEFETRIHVVTDLGPFADGEDVRGYARLRTAPVTSDKWQATIERGIWDLSYSLSRSLSAASRATTPPSAASTRQGGDR